MKSLYLFFALLVGLSFVPQSSFAQDAEAPAEAEDADAGMSEPTQKATNKVLEDVRAFADNLSDQNKRHFSVVYGNYNLIHVVKTVREDLGNAMEVCEEKNPELEGRATARYLEWTQAVDPVIKQAEANVGNMIIAQDYARPREFDQFFKKIDDAREQHAKDVKKVPVDSLEGCQGMIDKMDETQPNMIKLLNATLVSLPKAIQEEKMQKEKEAAENSSEEAAEPTERE